MITQKPRALKRYKVAVIQNQSELNQYSYADALPFVSRFYDADSFTAGDIEELICTNNLFDYDAIVLASNACNDLLILNALNANAERLEQFLGEGKGLLLLFQKKLQREEASFLPQSVRVFFEDRPASEVFTSGQLSKNMENIDTIVLNFPNLVDPSQVEVQSRRNPNLDGLYWRYIKAEQPTAYDTILLDSGSTPLRPLLLSTRTDLPHRVVASSLMLDWQHHDKLFENTLRYVVEGRPYIAVVLRQGLTRFDFSYMLENLALERIPYWIYEQSSLQIEQLPLSVHNTIILDPAWVDGKTNRSIATELPWNDLEDAQVRVIYFDMAPDQRTLLVKSVGGDRTFELVSRKLIAWLYSNFSRETGAWDSSFLRTASVLRTLLAMGESKSTIASQFGQSILAHIQTSDRDGSYDGVFGATCDLLEVYYELVGLEDQRFIRTSGWLKERFDKQDLPEQILAVLVLGRVNCREAQDFADKIYPRVIRYAANEQATSLFFDRALDFLLTYGHIKDIRPIILRLHELQDELTGLWDKNHQRTASIVVSLLCVRDRYQELSDVVNEMIFRGVLYFRTFLREFESRHQHSRVFKASDVAEAVWALGRFESEVRFPVDEFVYSLGPSSTTWRPSVQVDEFTTRILNIISANSRLREENTIMAVQAERNARDLELSNLQLDETRKTNEKLSESRRFSENLSLFFLTTSLGLAAWSLYLILRAQVDFSSELANFLRDWDQWLVFIIPILFLVTVGIYVGLLERYERMPKWLIRIFRFTNRLRSGDIQ